MGGKLIPCTCPPDRQAFIAVSTPTTPPITAHLHEPTLTGPNPQSLNTNVAAGHMVHNPSIPAPFPTGGSKADKQARIATLLSTLQNLHGPGVGCPAVSTVYAQIQQQVNALP